MTIDKALKVLKTINDNTNCDYCPLYVDELRCTVYKDGDCPIGSAIEMARDALRKQRKQEKRGEA